MRIKKISLLKYGPLEDCTHVINQSFQCITGPNESGKTILIDAIIKLLIPRNPQSAFGKEIDRITESPHGLLLLDVNGADVEVGSTSSNVEVLKESLQDIRDILIIRNSDLEILNQESCFDRVTDRLLGLRTSDIGVIIKTLKDRGFLTDKNLEISSAGGEDSPGNQLKSAKILMTDIKDYLDHEDFSTIKKIELDILSTLETLRILKQKRNELNKARNLQEYRKLETACENAEKNMKTLSEVPENFTLNANALLEEHSKLAVSQQTDIDRRILFDRLLVILSIGSGIGLLLTAIFQLGFLGIAQSLGVIIGFLLTLFLRLNVESRLNRYNKTSNEIILLLQSLNSETHDSLDPQKALRLYISRFSGIHEKLVESLGIMKSEIGIDFANPKEALTATRRELDKRIPDIDTSITREYNHEDLKETEKSISTEEERLSNLQSMNKQHMDKLANFESRLGSLRFGMYLDRPCRYIPDSMNSLPLVIDELSEYIRCIESNSEDCKIGIDIFREMDSEEKEKVSELLSKSKAVDIFKKITSGRYSHIYYIHKTKEIQVSKKDGTSFNTLSLSKGTLDQLFLSLRVGLAQQIFGTSPGFFIMDDPFLASDSIRRNRQITVLDEMLRNDWQILYFTANQELANDLHTRFGGTPIILKPLD